MAFRNKFGIYVKVNESRIQRLSVLSGLPFWFWKAWKSHKLSPSVWIFQGGRRRRQLYQTKSWIGSDKRSPVLFEQTDGSQIAVMAVHISTRLMPSASDNKDQRWKPFPSTKKKKENSFQATFGTQVDYATRNPIHSTVTADWLSRKRRDGGIRRAWYATVNTLQFWR